MNDTLRIAMLGVHSCPLGQLGTRDTGGMSVYIRELARELGKIGIAVDVYTRIHDPRDDHVYSLGENARLIHLNAGGIGEIDKLAIYPHLSDFTSSLEEFRQGQAIKYDLIFSHYWLSGIAGVRLQRQWDVPHFMMFHTMGAAKNALGIGEAEPELRIESESQLVRECHRIIASTEREKKALIRHLGASPDRIAVIPCGINLELFSPVDKVVARSQLGLGDRKLILYVGRIEPLKGIDRLIRAVSYLEEGPKAELAIIGGGEDSQAEIERLRQLSRSLNIADRVSFLGLVKQETLPVYYSAADVCVNPSYYETFGLMALESLACGTPVVASNVGGCRDIIRQGETGYVLPDNSPDGIAEKLAALLSPQGANLHSSLAIRSSVSQYG